jgi:ribA/ribD-fused uncharacterized protein
MENRISQFDTEWSDFSNFAHSPLVFQGRTYPTAEHAYQASKVYDPENQLRVQYSRSAGEAKILGNLYKDHSVSDLAKVSVMADILRMKFSTNRYFADLLLSTNDRVIEEGNTWGDTFWGVCNGIGENHLGNILMLVRNELKSGKLIIRDPVPTLDLLPAEPIDFRLNHPYSRRHG